MIFLTIGWLLGSFAIYFQGCTMNPFISEWIDFVLNCISVSPFKYGLILGYPSLLSNISGYPKITKIKSIISKWLLKGVNTPSLWGLIGTPLKVQVFNFWGPSFWVSSSSIRQARRFTVELIRSTSWGWSITFRTRRSRQVPFWNDEKKTEKPRF